MPSDTRPGSPRFANLHYGDAAPDEARVQIDADRCAWPRSDATARQFRFDTAETDKGDANSAGRRYGIPGCASACTALPFT